MEKAHLDPAMAHKEIVINDGLLKSVRVAQNRPDTVRVVLDANGARNYTATLLSSPYRLVIEVQSESQQQPISNREGRSRRSADCRATSSKACDRAGRAHESQRNSCCLVEHIRVAAFAARGQAVGREGHLGVQVEQLPGRRERHDALQQGRDAPGASRPLLEGVVPFSPTGKLLHLHAQMAHSPAVLAAYTSIRQATAAHGTLEPRVRAALMLDHGLRQPQRLRRGGHVAVWLVRAGWSPTQASCLRDGQSLGDEKVDSLV